MLDPKEQAKNGFRAAADRHSSRESQRPRRDALAADSSEAVSPADQPRADDTPPPPVLTLHRSEPRTTAAEGAEVAAGPAPRATLVRDPDAPTPVDGAPLYGAILARLAANCRHAEAAGWTSCDIERDGETGQFRLVGVAPNASQRTVVPDWTAAVAVDAAARRGDPPPAGRTPSRWR